MEISGISSLSYSSATQQSDSSSLRDQAKLDKILSKYDSENMDESSLAELKSELSEANLSTSKSLGDKIMSAGFDPEELRPERSEGSEKAEGKKGNRPPPPPKGDESSETSSSSSSQLNVNVLQPLSEILQEYDLSNLSSSDQSSLIDQLETEGILQTGLMIDLSV